METPLRPFLFTVVKEIHMIIAKVKLDSRSNRFIPGDTSTVSFTVATWLDSDLLNRRDFIEEWISRLNELSSNNRKSNYLGTGNAFSLLSNGEQVLVFSEFASDQRALLDKTAICQFLEQAVTALKQTSQPDLSVEVLDAGESAMAHYQSLVEKD